MEAFSYFYVLLIFRENLIRD